MGLRAPELWWPTGTQRDTKGGIDETAPVSVTGGLKADVGAGGQGGLCREGSPPGCVFSLQVLRKSEVK